MERKRRVGFTVRALSNQIRREMDRRHGPENDNYGKDRLTGMHFGVLHYISEHENSDGVFQKDIEAAFNIRRSTATGILQLMEKNGFIRRTMDGRDNRLKRITLTDKARAMQERADRDIDEMEKTITADISEQELETFYAVVDRMFGNLKHND